MSSTFIEEVPHHLRPRERFMEVGVKALTHQELLAIMIRTGTKGQNVLDVAYNVLKHFDQFSEFKYVDVNQLVQINGIGPTKAMELMAAIEFGRRVAYATTPNLGKVDSTDMAGQFLLQFMKDLIQEHMVVLFLNTKNMIIKTETIFIGTVNRSVAHPREIFREAVKYPTARIIVAHNHPSGDPTPSPADISFTKRLIAAGDVMGIAVLDHIIIGQNEFVSIHETTNLFE